MLLQFEAAPFVNGVVLSKEVRIALAQRTAESDSDRVKIAVELIEAVRRWHKHNARDYLLGSPEHDSFTDQATYAIRLVKKELGVAVKYVKKDHAYVIRYGSESATAYG